MRRTRTELEPDVFTSDIGWASSRPSSDKAVTVFMVLTSNDETMEPPEPIVIVPADPGWSNDFKELGSHLRKTLGSIAIRIDHVGSTSVPGLDAKPVIDVQIAVAHLEPSLAYAAPLKQAGFVFRSENPDLSKRFFRSASGARRTHIHVRRLGSFDEQLNLLFRDFLRTHPDAAREYARIKWDLSVPFRDDREGYVRAKEPTIWAILRQAHEWA